MSSDNLNPEWPEAACKYLSNALPLAHDGEGWEHSCSSAYQVGCETLVKLGYVGESMAENLPKSELKRKGVTYAKLVEKLAAIGISEKEVNVAN